MKPKIDERRCQGFGMCALAAPTVFQVGERDGYAIALVEEIPAGDIDAARKAVKECPMRAIKLIPER